MKKSDKKTYFVLNLLLSIYSISSVCSKLAATEEFLSARFCLYYSIVILTLGIYALGWQQIIKKLPLTAAFANKAITVVWGIIWGMLIFHEKLSIGKAVGAAMVVGGVILFAISDNEDKENV